MGNTEMSYLNLTIELQLGFRGGYGWARVLSLAGEPGPVMGGVRPAVETVVYVDAETAPSFPPSRITDLGPELGTHLSSMPACRGKREAPVVGGS